MVAPIAPLLRTKLHLPIPRPDTLLRPELLARLDSALELGIRLVLLSAPAGYGKTTLAASWLAGLVAHQTAQAAWLSLDADENDPVRFWSYFIAALQTVVPEAGGDSLSLLHATPPAPLNTVLALLLNDLVGLSAPLVVALDDFHTILTPEIHTGLAYCLDHLPPGVIIAVLTRADPFLPMARLHARRQVLELRLGDLRFSTAEEQAFFTRTMQLDLSEEQVSQLERIAEGWAAGLQMAALSLKRAPDLNRAIHAYGSRDRLLLDFFTEEILAALPSAEQDFLVRTALLEPFCAELCNAVLEIADSSSMIAALERQNLFITPLDSTRTWYRYHPLFADLLLQRVQSHLSGEALAGLHFRAAGWYAANRFNDQAIRHYLAADQRAAASHLVEAAAIQHLMLAEIVTVQNWLAAFGQDWLDQDPVTSTVQAWTMLANLRFHEVEPFLKRAERLLELAVYLPEEQRRHLQGQIAAIRATVASNLRDVTTAEEQARRALPLLPEWNLALRALLLLDLGDLCRTRSDFVQAQHYFEEAVSTAQAGSILLVGINASANLGNLQLRLGNLRRGEQFYRQAQKIAVDGGAPRLPVVGTAEIGLARVYLMRNDLRQARAHADLALELFHLWNHPLHITFAHFFLAEIQLMADDLEGAAASLRAARDLIQKRGLSFLEAQAGILEARLLLRDQAATGRTTSIAYENVERLLKAAGDWIDPERADQNLAQMGLVQPGALLVCARLRALRGEMNQAQALLEAGLQAVHSYGMLSDEACLHLLRASLLAEINHESALLDLEAALRLAEPENFRSIFASEGQPIIRLLQSWLAEHPGPQTLVDFARGLLEEFSPPEKTPPLPVAVVAARGPSVAPTVTSITPHNLDALSEREVEVLRLVSAGLSNDDIAAELIVSTNTIKTHLKRIFDKLHVNNRLEAVNQARELKIL
jgi:LuxR family maltose regulon positive regulatory protein